MLIANAQTPTKLNSLPKRILYMILDMVYSESHTSINIVNNPRPDVPYEKVREISFEHRIINTKALRSVCQAFHTWALEKVLCGSVEKRNGEETEIDGSNFESLLAKFGLTRNGIIKRLLDDFPSISGSGVILYLGDPSHCTNVPLVRALKDSAPTAFSSFSFSERQCIDRKKHLNSPLRIFRDWERLNVYMTICCGIFEGIDDTGEDAPRERFWTIRASRASSPCIKNSKPRPAMVDGGFKYVPRVSCRPDWDETSVGKLLESCRSLRTVYEEKTKQIAAWKIEIHLSVLVGDKIGGFCVHDMIFMPLNKPPTTVLKSCSTERCDGKTVLEEEWMEAKQGSAPGFKLAD